MNRIKNTNIQTLEHEHDHCNIFIMVREQRYTQDHTHVYAFIWEPRAHEHKTHTDIHVHKHIQVYSCRNTCLMEYANVSDAQNSIHAYFAHRYKRAWHRITWTKMCTYTCGQGHKKASQRQAHTARHMYTHTNTWFWMQPQIQNDCKTTSSERCVCAVTVYRVSLCCEEEV